MARGVLVEGRDAHEAGKGQAELVATARDEGIGIAGQAAGFLRLLAGIDLDETGERPPRALETGGEAAGDAVAIDGVDHVEQLDGLVDLVALQGADKMEFDAVKTLAKAGPFFGGLLHAVLAEDAVAGIQHGFDAIERLFLRDRDQRDIGRIAPRLRGGGLDAGADVIETAHVTAHISAAISVSSSISG